MPVHGVRGHRFRSAAEVPGELRHVRVDGEAGCKPAAAHGQPLHALNGLRQPAANRQDAANVAVGHADGVVPALAGGAFVVGIVGRSLVVGAQEVALVSCWVVDFVCKINSLQIQKKDIPFVCPAMIDLVIGTCWICQGRMLWSG